MIDTMSLASEDRVVFFEGSLPNLSYDMARGRGHPRKSVVQPETQIDQDNYLAHYPQPIAINESNMTELVAQL